jgi:hypothetical protein
VTTPHAASLLSQVLADLGQSAHCPAPVSGHQPARTRHGRQVQLPAASAPHRTTGAAMAGRTSHRRYGGRPILPTDMRALCDEALLAGQLAWSCAGDADLEVGVLALALNVTAVPAGAYQYSGAGTLQWLAAMVNPTELGQFVLQKEFTSAPLLLIITGALGRAITALGTHGYRLLLVRGGAAVQAAWIGAERRGLVGCAFAGLLPRRGRLPDGAANRAGRGISRRSRTA